jgi:hypothetical protein
MNATEGVVDQKLRKFNTWRWSPAGVGSRGLRTNCAASVMLSSDLATGAGTVLIRRRCSGNSPKRMRTTASKATCGETEYQNFLTNRSPNSLASLLSMTNT